MKIIAALILSLILSCHSVHAASEAPEYPEEAKQLNQKVKEHFASGNILEAIVDIKKSLEITEKALGKDNWNTHILRNDLAHFYRLVGQYADAVVLYEQSLDVAEKTMGNEHKETAALRMTLAELYRFMERPNDAEAMYKEALEIEEKIIGQERPNAIDIMLLLAELYASVGKYDDAEKYYKRAFDVSETVFGPKHDYVSMSLYRLASFYKARSRVGEAEALFKRGLDIAIHSYGTTHPAVASSWLILKLFYMDQKRVTEARYAQDQFEAINRRLSDNLLRSAVDIPTDESAKSLLEKAVSLSQNGQGEIAVQYAIKALILQENALGIDHPDIVITLGTLAGIYNRIGKSLEAEGLLQRSLEIRRKTFGEYSIETVRSCRDLAELYVSMKEFTKAEELYRQAISIMERLQGKESPAVAELLVSLGQCYIAAQRFAEAENMFMRARSFFEMAYGKDHKDTIGAQQILAGLYWQTGRVNEALALLNRTTGVVAVEEKMPSEAELAQQMSAASSFDIEKAISIGWQILEIQEKRLGKENPQLVGNLMEVARLYGMVEGGWAQSEPIYKRVLQLLQSAQETESYRVAIILDALAMQYRYEKRYSEAVQFGERALAIREKMHGDEYVLSIINTMLNLGMLYRLTERNDSAEVLLKKAVASCEKVACPDFRAADALISLYTDTGRNVDAETLDAKVGERRKIILEASIETRKANLAMIENGLMRDNYIIVSADLIQLASDYSYLQQYEEAINHYKKALEINKRVLSDMNPSLTSSISAIAYLYGAQGKHKESHDYLQQSTTIQNAEKEKVFMLSSERRKLEYVKRTSWNMHIYLSHSVQYMSADNNALIDTMNQWLLWKGSLIEAQGRYIDAAVSNSAPEIRTMMEDLTRIRRELAGLEVPERNAQLIQAYRNRMQGLQMRKEALEADLSALSESFRREKLIRQTDTYSLAKTLPQDGVYLDFANIALFDFRPPAKGESHDPLLRYTKAKSRYLVFVLIPGDQPTIKLIDLAGTDEINDHIKAYREEMQRAVNYGEVPRNSVLAKEAMALYKIIMQPLEPYFKDKKRVFISPDGNLNLIPFEVLLNSDGKSLIEEHVVSYVAAGRDVIRFNNPHIAKGDSLIIADPDYNMKGKEKDIVTASLMISTPLRGVVSRDLKDIRFSRLRDTKWEADAIEKILGAGVRNYQGKSAIEEVLLSAEPPRVLHLATHGYFLRQEVPNLTKEISATGADNRIISDKIENPMLRSGIVFAGANTSLAEGRDDGIVSAEKVLGLNLKDTDLVVLSACETGIGDVEAGEGVFGLKRAFILSGAKSLVMSLWSIPSRETTELMTWFYRGMAEGQSKAEALRQAKLNMMKKHNNPFYWGAFVLTGNP